MKKSRKEKFNENVGNPTGEKGCTFWLKYTTKKGYGLTSYRGHTITTHRLAWILNKGEIPENLYVLHTCDNPSCVNIKHLFLGSSLDNNRDCIQKGRNAIGKKHGRYTRPERTARGENNGSHKLTESQVLNLRRDFAIGNVSRRALAGAYGVTLRTVCLIVDRKAWKHL